MQKTHDVMRVMASVQNAITKNKAPQMRGWVASGRCVQAMYTAMKASRKIMAAPTAGITTGIRCNGLGGIGGRGGLDVGGVGGDGVVMGHGFGLLWGLVP